jgi:hypothetical protein
VIIEAYYTSSFAFTGRSSCSFSSATFVEPSLDCLPRHFTGAHKSVFEFNNTIDLCNSLILVVLSLELIYFTGIITAEPLHFRYVRHKLFQTSPLGWSPVPGRAEQCEHSVIQGGVCFSGLFGLTEVELSELQAFQLI